MYEPRSQRTAYTFGDTEVAARRLDLLAQVYGPSSRALLSAAMDRAPSLAYDLGCGPGHTTTLIAEQTLAARTIGLDSSAAFISRAKVRASVSVDFAVHDALKVPFPAGQADLIYCRLLLAHIANPTAAIHSWAGQLTAGGVVIVDEIEWIATHRPLLRAHLSIAEALIATRGGSLYAGPQLADLADSSDLRCNLSQIAQVNVSTAVAATMFAMNLAAWGRRPVALGICSERDLTKLTTGITELTKSSAVGEITWGMRQAAYRRTT
jgi:trans-aconitate 2-methyltransferase